MLLGRPDAILRHRNMNLVQLDLFNEPSRNWPVKHHCYPLILHGPEVHTNGVYLKLNLLKCSLVDRMTWEVELQRWNYNLKSVLSPDYSYTVRRWNFGEDRAAADDLASRLADGRRFSLEG